MRIADEIDHVMREFVAFEDVFLALVEEQELRHYQIGSWLLRHEHALSSLQMIECNQSIKDFRLLEKSWVSDYLYALSRGEEVDWDETDTGRGFRAGWLRSDLQRFFKGTQVDYPEKAMAKRRTEPKFEALPSPDAPVAEPEVDADADLGEDTRPLATRERSSLLTIVAALAGEANISLVTPSKSAELISSLTEKMGTPVGKRTIEEHLKKVPDALERKTR